MKNITVDRKARALLLIAFMWCALTPSRIVASEVKPLPAFNVTALDGSTVASDKLATDSKWLLVYAEASCRTCEQLYDAFRQEESNTNQNVKVIVIVGGATIKEVERIAKRVSWIDHSSWYADPGKLSSSALRLKGTPVVHGIQDGKVMWDLSGVLPDAKTLESLLETWSAPSPAAPPAAPPSAGD